MPHEELERMNILPRTSGYFHGVPYQHEGRLRLLKANAKRWQDTTKYLEHGHSNDKRKCININFRDDDSYAQ